MSLQLQMEQMSDYLAARFTGAGVPEEASQQFELIAEHCKRTKNDKLLIRICRPRNSGCRNDPGIWLSRREEEKPGL